MNWCHVIRAQGGCITYEHDDDDDDTSWLLSKWRLVNEFLDKTYRANEWMDKIDFN